MSGLTTHRSKSPNIVNRGPTRSVSYKRTQESKVQYAASDSDECDSKVLDGKTSQDTFTEDPDKDVTDTNEQEEYDDSNRRMVQKRLCASNTYRYSKEYPEYVPQAVMALRRLEKLKELQRRRDITERFYSNEIRRIIAEHYMSPRPHAPPLNHHNYSNNSKLSPCPDYPPKNFLKSMEPCGTMTVITRLDCGCMQETTRPIFTTVGGHIQRRSCEQSHDQVYLMPAGQMEHLCSAVEGTKGFLQKPKNRSPSDSRNFNPKLTTFARSIKNKLEKKYSNTSI